MTWNPRTPPNEPEYLARPRMALITLQFVWSKIETLARLLGINHGGLQMKEEGKQAPDRTRPMEPSHPFGQRSITELELTGAKFVGVSAPSAD